MIPGKKILILLIILLYRLDVLNSMNLETENEPIQIPCHILQDAIDIVTGPITTYNDLKNVIIGGFYLIKRNNNTQLTKNIIAHILLLKGLDITFAKSALNRAIQLTNDKLMEDVLSIFVAIY